MSLQYIIDGYNIINHPAFTRAHNKKIRDKRHALISLIKTDRLSGSSKNGIVIVFDGYPSLEDSRALGDSDPAVKVVFSRRESADEKIERIVEASVNPKNIIVVSDDRQVQFVVKSLNASSIGVEEFITRPEKSKKKRENDNDGLEMKVSYTQMHNINQELRKLWLK